MGKVTKKASEKHNVSLSPAIADFIQRAASLPLIQLPLHLAALPRRWPFPRGDLYNWIEVLDRFDGILENFIAQYGLNDGPQTRRFESSLLLADSAGTSPEHLRECGFGPEGDRELAEAILSFSRLLLDKCGNRALYNSTERLNDLLNTTSLSLLHITLRLTTFLAHRFHERNPTPPHNVSSFYSFDNDKFHKIAAPFASPTALAGRRNSTATPKSTKSKDKPPQVARGGSSSSSLNPNDFRSLSADLTLRDMSDESQIASLNQEWEAWASVKVVWSPVHEVEPDNTDSTSSVNQGSDQDGPATPTPSRRQPSMLSRTPTSSSVQMDEVMATPSTSAPAAAEKSGLQVIELSAPDLLNTNATEILRNAPKKMPSSSRYELLHKLRVAYGLVTSPQTRTQLLEVRLLALTVLAYIYDEHEFPQKLFGLDANPSARQQLIQQIVSLLQGSQKEFRTGSMYLQSLAMECLGVLSRQRVFSSEITNALAPNSSHGLLLSLTEKALKDIQNDDDETDNKIGDDWREAVFLLLPAFMLHGGHSIRSSEAVIHSSLISAYASGLKVFTNKALRVHLRILDFMKSFSRHFKDGLQVLSANHAFEAACQMLDSLTTSALDLLRNGQGIAQEFKTKVTDYQILYMYQQVIRSMIDLVNDVFSLQGGNAERILRNLVDSQPFLNAFKSILSSIEAFGAHTWSEVVKAIVGFLHNEPTSYTIISEAGIIKTLLDMVVVPSALKASADEHHRSAIPDEARLNIPPVSDAIVNLSQAFGAICLTNAGFDAFKSSGALEDFFRIFESPEHVKAIKDANTLALLGSTFDELVRHHPSLRNSVLSIVITMTARVRHICHSRAWQIGAGAKLWVDDTNKGPRVSGGVPALLNEITPLEPDQQGSTIYKPFKLPDGSTLEPERNMDLPHDSLAVSATDVHADGLTVIDFARPAVCFLMNFFENQQLCIAFMEAGATDLVLDFTTLPSLPANEQTFGPTNAIAHELTNLIHMMAETKPAIVLPALVDRAQYACEYGLSDFYNAPCTTAECFFEPFIRQTDGDTAMDIETGASADVLEHGTRHVKSLTTVLILVQVLSETFNLPIFNARAPQNAMFASVNLADVLAKLCRMLGSLNAACFREEIALQAAIPESWLMGTRPLNFSTGDEEVDKILNINGEAQTSENDKSDDHTSEQDRKQQENLGKDKATVAYKNAQTLRYLLIETPNSITEFFQRLGRGLAGRKRLETFTKQKISLVADALAEAYVTQLQPSFMSKDCPSDDQTKRSRFGYQVIALSNVRSSLYDDSPNMGPSSSRQAFVVGALKEAHGLQVLTRIGKEFFDELKSCQVTQSTFSANAGLKICLDILDDLCNAKNIVDSSQGSWMKNTEPTKAFYFNPDQLLLELRIESLPLVRLIWDSEYADQASNDVVQKLVSILQHVFNGESESEAFRNPASCPTIHPHQKRAFFISPAKVSMLHEKGYPEDLAHEALYRSNAGPPSSSNIEEEYCKAVTNNPRRRRLPPPAEEIHTSTDSIGSGMRSPPSLPFSLFSGDTEDTFAQASSNIHDDEMDDVDDDEDDDDEDNEDDDDNDEHIEGQTITAPSGPSESIGSAMDLSNILNQPESGLSTTNSSRVDPQKPKSAKTVGYIETIDAEREAIREELPERCNNILNNHQNLTFELSELIVSASKKLSDDAVKIFWENTSDLLVNSLLSMQADDQMTEVRGKKIAAAAHLTALLIQDNKVFENTKKVFQESYSGLLSFLETAPIAGASGEESSAPWVAPVLLIVERMLSLDAEPPEVQWQQPKETDSSPEPKFIHRSVLEFTEKKRLFELLMKLLFHVGKDKSMALAIVRVLVILTRHRELATLQSHKSNLQRLFVMVKQLGSGAQGRLQNSFLLILRHIIEDDETIKQIMRSEMVGHFAGRNSSRQVDVVSFVRDNYHLVLRSPELFVEVANEKLKIANWGQHSTHFTLTLKDEHSPDSKQDLSQSVVTNDKNIEQPPAASVESGVVDKSKSSEIRLPVVEHPDGIIHFLLSELLTYKDVDDKEQLTGTEVRLDSADSTPQQDQTASRTSSSVDADVNGNESFPPEKQEKPRFKADDHPMFMYRCFLLHCLTELLYSYNRTKVEFINFSRKQAPVANTPSKPRSGVLNYLINGLVCSGYVDKDESINCKKRMTTSDWAIRVIVALCWKTGEKGRASPAQRFAAHAQIEDQDDESDLNLVRRFTLEQAIKAFKDATVSSEALQSKYSRLLCLGGLFHRLLQKPAGPEGAAGSHNTSYKVLGRMMFEKNLVSVLTSSLTEVDLSYPSAKKVIKFILRPMQELTTLAVDLSIHSPEAITSAMGNDVEDFISSSSSVADIDDMREETPDLFRNSALGMLDPSRQAGSDTSDDEDEDEEMYDEGYEDEMEYDDGGAAPNDGEVVSDEELDDRLDGAGPIEGLPGDQPMDIELVMDDSLDHSDSESDDSEDDEEDDDDDDDNDDFEVEMDDDGEINADDENDSLGAGEDREDDWEDEDDEGDEDEVDVTFEGDDLPEPIGLIGGSHGTQSDLNNLLRVLGEHDGIDPGPPPPVPQGLIVESDHRDDIDPDDDEDDDDGEEGDDLDENDGLDFDDGFNTMLDGDDIDESDQWAWGEPPPAVFRRHRQPSGIGRGHLPFTASRRIHTMESEFSHMMGGRHHRHAPQARNTADHTTNPLLQRPETGRTNRAGGGGSPFSVTVVGEGGMPGLPPTLGGGGMISMQIPVGINPHNLAEIGGHGAVLDALLQAVSRNGRGFPSEAFRVQMSGSSGFHEVMRSVGDGMFHHHHHHHHHHSSRQPREDPGRVASFTPMLTSNRWQEEARMLFGNNYPTKLGTLHLWVTSRMVPFAQEEERRRKQAEEEKRKKEAEEAEKRRIEKEREKKEREEQEAAEQAAKEAKAREEAEAAAATEPTPTEAQQSTAITEEMEGVQSGGQAEAAESSADAPAPERVFTTIRGRRLDITDLAIDLDYLEALPEELREEVIMQQYTDRRQAAQTDNVNANSIDPTFLDALPEEIREEIRQQEAHMQRRLEREEARRQAVTQGAVQAEEMDNDDFFATLDPALRRAILAEQPPEILSQLDSRHAAEGRAHQRGLFYHHRIGEGRNGRDDRARRDISQKEKRQVVQLIDKAGVATLLRLMFLPQQGSLKTNLWQILSNVCGNRQTRFEVISLLLVILKEGSTDVTAVERSLANLSLRARAVGSQKTPQPLRRTLSVQPHAGLSEDVTPLVVVQQCLATLQALCRAEFHIRTIFLREVDVSVSKGSKKSKGKENKTTKYPLNDVIGLLDRRLIIESSSCLQILADLLQSITAPLPLFIKREKSEELSRTDEPASNPEDHRSNANVTVTAEPVIVPQSLAPSQQDATMGETPVTEQSISESATEGQEVASDKKDNSAEDPTDEQESLKKKQPFEPPVISDHNLRLITSVFITPECHNETFHNILETVKHLSEIPGASAVFSQELISHVQTLSQSISSDLDELLPLIQEAQSTSDLQGITSSKFSASSSDQVKLLRVLQALDFLKVSKKEGDTSAEDVTSKSILTESYSTLTLGPLWHKLSACLTAVREKGDTIGFANILLALIESLMVVCKNTPLKDAPVLGQGTDRPSATAKSDTRDDDLEELFFKFTTEHRKILNDIVRQNPKLMQGNGNFSLLVKNSKVLDFDNKRNYFTKQLHGRHQNQRHVQPPLQLSVNRNNVFLDSYKYLYFKSAEEMKYGKLNIRFQGEEGVDAGGVTREWFQVLARGMFDPNYALFSPVASDRTTFHPNNLSAINPEHLAYFKFIGRIIGKALHEGRVLDCHFSRAVYKRILGKSPNLKDLESNDVDYYKSLVWILENDITDILTEEFCVIENMFGEEKVVDLIPDGRNIAVSEDNKREYVQKLVEYRLTESVKEQLDSFLQGFHDIIPADLVAIFNEQELELLISGLPEIDVDDWKANTEYHNYSPSSPQIVWFWRTVRGMSNEERAKLLQFITGTSKVPLNGFKELEGVSGLTKFNIHKDPSTDRLPTSHTCFNQLDLPVYDGFETMKQNLMTAINLGADYFGFA